MGAADACMLSPFPRSMKYYPENGHALAQPRVGLDCWMNATLFLMEHVPGGFPSP